MSLVTIFNSYSYLSNMKMAIIPTSRISKNLYYNVGYRRKSRFLSVAKKSFVVCHISLQRCRRLRLQASVCHPKLFGCSPCSSSKSKQSDPQPCYASDCDEFKCPFSCSCSCSMKLRHTYSSTVIALAMAHDK